MKYRCFCKPMDFIDEIMRESGCGRDIAKKSWVESNNQLDRAVDLAKKYYHATLPLIATYSNGILIRFNSKSTFYSYSEPENIELKQMLVNGEFDKDILGLSEDMTDAIIECRETEEYFDKNHISEKKVDKNSSKVNSKDPSVNAVNEGIKKMKIHSNNNLSLSEKNPDYSFPKEIVFDEFGTLRFRIVYQNRSIRCKIDENATIKRIIEEIHQICNRLPKFDKRGEFLDEDESVRGIRQCTINMKF